MTVGRKQCRNCLYFRPIVNSVDGCCEMAIRTGMAVRLDYGRVIRADKAVHLHSGQTVHAVVSSSESCDKWGATA